MKQITILILTVLASFTVSHSQVTLHNEGGRGILNLHSAKTIGEGNIYVSLSPVFALQDIGIINYSGHERDLEWNMFPTDRENSSFSMQMPISVGWGWSDYSTTGLGVNFFSDRIDVDIAGVEKLDKSGLSEVYILQKFMLPSPRPAISYGLVGQLYLRVLGDDGLILTDPKYHARNTFGRDDENYQFRTYTAYKSDRWAFKGIIPVTLDLSEINPDVNLELHGNIGGIMLNRGSPNENSFIGAFGAEYSPIDYLGVFGIINGSYKYSNFTNEGSITDDFLTFDFGLNYKHERFSATAGMIYAISESPERNSGDKIHYELEDDIDNYSWVQKNKYRTNTNASLYTRDAEGTKWLINSAVPPKWRLGIQLAYYIDLFKRDSDGDGINDRNDLCPNIPGLPEFYGCPNPDTDNDGVCDPWVSEKGLSEKFNHICVGIDLCPEKHGMGALNGCPPDLNELCEPIVDSILNLNAVEEVIEDTLKSEEIIEPEPVIEETKNEPAEPEVIIITKTPLRLEMYFEAGNARIAPTSIPILNRLVKTLKEETETRIMVEGHTDNVGSYELNMGLSLRRANAVKTHLVNNGIDESRIETDGLGFEKPIADNNTPEGRQINRRIEIRKIN